MRQLYKIALTATAVDGQRKERLFEAIEGERKGELYGLPNLMKFDECGILNRLRITPTAASVSGEAGENVDRDAAAAIAADDEAGQCSEKQLFDSVSRLIQDEEDDGLSSQQTDRSVRACPPAKSLQTHASCSKQLEELFEQIGMENFAESSLKRDVSDDVASVASSASAVDKRPVARKGRRLPPPPALAATTATSASSSPARTTTTKQVKKKPATAPPERPLSLYIPRYLQG
jgi:hypothetical protein